MHLQQQVAAADELAAHVALWDRRPIREFLDALADALVREHVKRLKVAVRLQDAHRRVREATLRELPRAKR